MSNIAKDLKHAILKSLMSDDAFLEKFCISVKRVEFDENPKVYIEGICATLVALGCPYNFVYNKLVYRMKDFFNYPSKCCQCEFFGRPEDAPPTVPRCCMYEPDEDDVDEDGFYLLAPPCERSNDHDDDLELPFS